MALFALATTLIASCSVMSDEMYEYTPGSLVLRVHLDKSRSARAGGDNPTGGENGDGLRPGEHHENDIDNIVLFCYNHRDGINAPADTRVTKLTYVDNIGFKPSSSSETTTDIVLKSVSYNHLNNDNFVVCVNSGDFPAATLGELRDKRLQYSLNETDDGIKANFTDFVMSNEGASRFAGGAGTAENPDIIEVDVERVMGRLDFCVDGSVIDNATNTRRYVASDGATNQKVGDVYLSHVRAFNVMQPDKTPYLIKRLGMDNTAYNYLGVEQKPAQALIVEPLTWQKDAPDVTRWYGLTAFDQMVRQGDSWYRDEDRIHTSVTGNGFTDGVSLDTTDPTDPQYYYVVDYANENTMTPENTTSQTTTGLALKAIYKPVNVYKSGTNAGNLEVDDKYAYGQTFWRYRPVETIYDETMAICFSTLEAATTYKSAHPEVQSEITMYENGRCYYPVYLRHDNSAKTPNIDIMEFGIVRNNIYRLKVEFTGPGYPKPEEIEVEPEGIHPYIFVRKWYKIMHPEIII